MNDTVTHFKDYCGPLTLKNWLIFIKRGLNVWSVPKIFFRESHCISMEVLDRVDCPILIDFI